MNLKDLTTRPFPFIIADIGSNFTDLESCMTGISLAKNCGADAVKFQMYTHEEMYGYPGKMKGELPKEWVPKLAEKAENIGIEFMCTGFSVEGYRYLDRYVSAHKVASSDLANVPILRYLRNSLKPVILSTGGGWGDSDIANAIRELESPPILLHCVSSYPAKRTCLHRITHLRNRFDCAVGYSDHSLSVFDIPGMASDLGSCVIEKHFNPMAFDDTPDAGHSLTIDDFKDMALYLKGNTAKYNTGRTEIDMKLMACRRIVAIKDIKAGELFNAWGPNANIGIFRTKRKDTKGLSGFVIDRAHGSRSTGDFKVGDGVHFNL